MRLLYFCFIWPEPQSSAAGFRTLQHLVALQNAGHQIVVCSACQHNIHQQRLVELGFETKNFIPNDSSIDTFLESFAPEIVFFDRFMIEEQFSWRVKTICPHALRVLDSIDLHSVRRIRQAKVKTGQEARRWSDKDQLSEDLIREVAAIYRSDITLLLSDYEHQLLTEQLRIPPFLLSVHRFFYPLERLESPSFEERKNFVIIGNFNHAPNVDSVKLLHSTLWPQMRDNLAQHGLRDVELHVYGAYPSHDVLALNAPSAGFRVQGWAEDAVATLSHYRVNLAPIRFGAGIKGKISDGWYAGTPCVTTAIGAEGMHEQYPFGGIIVDNEMLFAQAAADLYIEKDNWLKAQQAGRTLIEALYNQEKNIVDLMSCIEHAFDDKKKNRLSNLVGNILWSSQMRSTEYLSRWIEAKNK